MRAPTTSQIKEIAEQLDCGFCCYFNSVSGEIISFPDFDEIFGDIEEFYGEDLTKIKKDKKNFIKIDKPNAREGFELMEDFANRIENPNFRGKILDALARKRPFAHFKSIIEGAGDYRQKWFDFKQTKLQAYVLAQMPIQK